MSAPDDSPLFPTKHHESYAAVARSNHSGKSIFITGASKGIGRAMAVSYAKAGAANIIIAARSSLDDTEKEILAAVQDTASKPTILQLKVDVSSESSISDAVTAVKEKVGRLDILVNNAGYLETWKSIAESDPADWWKSWEINLKGVYLITRAFLPLLLQGGEKTIVNVSSVGAHRMRPGASAYQTNKFALLRFTEFLAVEYADQELLAFAIHPGGVPTELALGMPKHVHAALIDTPQLCGDTVAWLTQDKKQWLSGRYFSVNWDVTELLSNKDEIVKGDKLKMRMVV